MNLCRSCGQNFAFTSAFDAHRVGTHDYTYDEGLKLEPLKEDGRRCLDVEELKRAGWAKDRYSRWQPPGPPPPFEPLVKRVELGEKLEVEIVGTREALDRAFGRANPQEVGNG